MLPRNNLSVLFGSTGEHGVWKVVQEAFDQDQLDSASRLLKELSVGGNAEYESLFRMIEAESLTRRQAYRTDVSDWLSLEWILEQTSEMPVDPNSSIPLMESMASTFRLHLKPKVVLTILASEADAPWTVGRFGYCSPKTFGYKICVPYTDLANMGSFIETVSHEFAHVITGELSGGRVPRWVDEAVAMALQQSDLRSWPKLRHWRNPQELEAALNGMFTGQFGFDSIVEAYVQAGYIGKKLLELGTTDDLSRFLKHHRFMGTFQEIKVRLVGSDRTEEALHQVYGSTVDGLFNAALDHYKESRRLVSSSKSL